MILWVLVTAASTAFPIIAGARLVAPSTALGVADVAFAAAYAVLGMMLLTRARNGISKDAVFESYRLVQLGSYAIIVLLALFLLGISLDWPVLSIGLAWRAFLAIAVLPGAITAWRSDSR